MAKFDEEEKSGETRVVLFSLFCFFLYLSKRFPIKFLFFSNFHIFFSTLCVFVL